MRSLQRVLNLGQLCLRSLETSATESRGFAVQALQAGASTRVPDGGVSTSGQDAPVTGGTQAHHQLNQRRCMSYLYARKPEGKDYVNYENTAQFGSTLLTDYLIKTVPKFITMATVGPAQSSVLYQEPTIYTTPEHLVPLCYFLRDHVNTQFKCLVDITAVDFPERAARFEVVYHLLSPRYNNRIRIKVPVDELTPVPTIVPVYNAANWFERETWDMYGVFFKGHPDLRRILTDYGFTGHPLRKDFPLTGYTEAEQVLYSVCTVSSKDSIAAYCEKLKVRYDYAKKRVITEPLELTQEFRYFDFSSPWETLTR